MRPWKEPQSGPTPPAEDARVRVATALALLELAAQVLDSVPPPEAALALGDRKLFRYSQAAETAGAWLVGHEAGDSLERPGRGSALGDGARIYRWSEEQTERHFQQAVADWQERCGPAAAKDSEETPGQGATLAEDVPSHP